MDPLTLWENYCVAEGVQLPNLYQTICVSSNDGPIVPKLLPADPNGVIYLKIQDNNSKCNRPPLPYGGSSCAATKC